MPSSETRAGSRSEATWHAVSPVDVPGDGRVRSVGTVEEIQQTKDPVVRQFIEGRADLDDPQAA